jgi:glucose/arabinose dehydrogenase
MKPLASFLALVGSASFCVGQPAGLVERLPNSTLTLPQQLPVFGYTFTNAFGTNTFSSPLGIVTAPGESNRLFILEKGGRIQVMTNLGAANPGKSVYMDLRPHINSGGECGLLGLAFHPGFQTNGYFYVYRTINVTNAGPTTNLVQTLARYQAIPPSAATANTNTQQFLWWQQDLANNHNGGDLHFGPDGYLYITLGDGGNQNDSQNNSQTIRKGFNAGILRIDVDNAATNLVPNPPSSISLLTIFTNTYRVPADNPWVTNVFIHETNRSAALSTNIRTEYYAVGLRNPWRMSFDPVTGLLYCGDVGGGSREEVSIIRKGGNYGWGYREGFTTGPKSGQTNTWYNAATPPPWATNFVPDQPILDYGRGATGTNVGNSITGGIVYRGGNLSQLNGFYIYADYGSASPGNVWAFRYDGTNVTQFQQLLQDPGFVGFGHDPRNGDVLVADIVEGAVKRLVYATNFTGAPLPATLAETGAFTNLATLAAHAGIVPYSLNVPFWSDNAIKSRWFSVPNTNLAIGYDPTNNWAFPTGTVWIKHFELVTNHLTQARTRLETRFLVRNPAGVYGVTYRWGGQTNAELVGDGGLDEAFVITDPGGILRTQVWRYPSRTECLSCHNPVAGHALGFHTAQLNRDHAYINLANATGLTDNQLRALSAVGYFTPAIGNVHTLPALANWDNTAASLEWRVRSWLAANCASCHLPGGSGGGTWDARSFVPTALAGIIEGGVVNNLGNPAARIIATGSLTNSMLYQRAGGFTGSRMPPLATSVLDTNNLNLLATWIGSASLAGYQTFSQWQLANFGSTLDPAAQPGADPDGDGLANELEHLLGTDPKATSDWKVDIQMNGANPQITFPHVANRAFEVQCRTNLEIASPWLPLQVAGNTPQFPAVTFTNVVEDTTGSGTNKTYRVRVFAP